jgi:hypothetical protein
MAAEHIRRTLIELMDGSVLFVLVAFLWFFSSSELLKEAYSLDLDGATSPCL